MSEIPESNRLIILKCDNCFGDYEIEGMFIDYKKPIKKGKRILKSRFCTYDNDTKTWDNDMCEWRQRNSWSYK